MARCTKKTLGGGGCQTCNGSQAKGPAAILIFETKKKAKRSADGKARRQGESRGKANNPNTEHNQEKKRQEKGEGNGREKTKAARQPGGTEKRDKRDKKKEQQSKKQRKAPQGKAHRPQANPPKRPTTKPPETRTPKGGTRGKGLMRPDTKVKSHQSSRCAQGQLHTKRLKSGPHLSATRR